MPLADREREPFMWTLGEGLEVNDLAPPIEWSGVDVVRALPLFRW